ncbi:MAG: signal recognition particle protein [Candidatus Aenigmarchaeota archaeon]|nr:signal recognition particle protein [Candidatus Aenigmarchaeota archaeon]
MFDNLSKGLGNLIRKLVTGTAVDKEAVEEVLVDLKKILLESDVDIQLTENLVNEIREKCLQEKIPSGLTLREHVLKVIYDELVKLLGGRPSELLGKKRLMTVGLYGSGKTTSIGKLARYFIKQGLKPALVGLDYHRPAAPQQLQQISKQIGVSVYVDEKTRDPYSTARTALEKYSDYDVVIFDTAGRNALDKELADELKKLYEIIKPDEVLLVLPADLGKVARVQAEEFHKLVGVTGVIITKMDGTAKAGGALAATSVTGSKVKFIGTGEKLDAFETYNPERFVSRLLGLGDLQTLLEKAKEAEINPEKVERIAEGKFTLQDFMEQIEGMQKMGPMSQIMNLIPGMGMAKIPKDLVEKQEQKMKAYKIIIQSMTKVEREDPGIVNATRISRIAKGSGRTEAEVRELLNQYNQTKKMLRSLGGMKGLQRGEFKKLAQQFGLKM